MKSTSALLAAAAALLLSLPALALPEEAKPNTLTPQQAAAGWILLFDGETPFGWAPRGAAKWQIRDGIVSAVPGSGKGVLSTNTEFADYHLGVDFWIDEKANSGVFLRCATSGEISGANGYEVNIYD